MIHQPVSVVLQCSAERLAEGTSYSGDQRRLTGSGSALEAIATMRYTNPHHILFLRPIH